MSVKHWLESRAEQVVRGHQRRRRRRGGRRRHNVRESSSAPSARCTARLWQLRERGRRWQPGLLWKLSSRVQSSFSYIILFVSPDTITKYNASPLPSYPLVCNTPSTLLIMQIYLVGDFQSVAEAQKYTLVSVAMYTGMVEMQGATNVQ